MVSSLELDFALRCFPDFFLKKLKPEELNGLVRLCECLPHVLALEGEVAGEGGGGALLAVGKLVAAWAKKRGKKEKHRVDSHSLIQASCANQN